MTATASNLESFFRQNLNSYLNFLQQMVAINSYTANSAGINELGGFTAGIFADLGFSVETIQSTNPRYGKHFVLTRSGNSGKTIGLVSHLDTVFPPEEEEQNDFRWRVVGGKIYGPGTVDIKGGTLMIYMICHALRQFCPHLFDEVNWVIFLDASEERDATDFGELVKGKLPANNTLGCLIFEAGILSKTKKSFKLVVCRKGMANYTVTTTGKAAHAGSYHENGSNAIVQMAAVIQKIAAFTDYSRNLTFNVGTITGGTVTNRVPHESKVQVEMRAFASNIFEDGVQQMLALDGSSTVGAANGSSACRVNVMINRRTQAWPENAGTNHLFDIWSQAAAKYGYQALRERRGGLSDGNMFWQHVPCLDGLGPSGGNAHCSEQAPNAGKEQEFVLISSFVPKAVINTLSIIRLCSIISDLQSPISKNE